VVFQLAGDVMQLFSGLEQLDAHINLDAWLGVGVAGVD